MNTGTVVDVVAIVGAGPAGCKVAEGLRQNGYAGAIVVISSETWPPYDRPPLSKQILAKTFEFDEIALLTDGRAADLDVDLRLGVRAIGVDGQSLLLDDGSRVEFSTLVIATGVAARQFAAVDPAIQHRVHTLRTLDHSLALRAQLVPGATVVIVGAGFIGAEVASAATDAGCSVTLLEAADGPAVRIVGAAVAAELSELYRANGVDLRLNANVTAITRGENGRPVVHADGEDLVCDLVVVGVGTVADYSWLPGDVDRLDCTADGLVLGTQNVYAIGDIAAWPDPWGTHRRIEHWERASEHARVVSASIAGTSNGSLGDSLGAGDTIAPAPYFWSDQFSVKVQMCGWGYRADSELALVHTSGRTLRAYVADGSIVAALTVGAPALLARSRALVSRRVAIQDFIEALGLRPATDDEQSTVHNDAKERHVPTI